MSNKLSIRVDDLAGTGIDRNDTFTMRVEGEEIQACRGDSIASAMLANGMRQVAPSIYLERPRGIVAAGIEDPNALIGVTRDKPRTISEAMLVATATPATKNTSVVFNQGLGALDPNEDPEEYDYIYDHPDVLVVGAGPAGLAAARQAASQGARVLLMDESYVPGGSLLASPDETIDGKPAQKWIDEVVAELAANPDVTHLQHTTVFGAYENGYFMATQRRTDHLDDQVEKGISRERLWHIRAKSAVLATGAHERPVVFENNDRPGIILAGSVQTYMNRYGVQVGKNIAIFTTNDSVYPLARQLQESGSLALVIDTRQELSVQAQKAVDAGVKVVTGSVVVDTDADTHGEVSGISYATLNAEGELGEVQKVEVDTLAVSGGYSPVIHLHSQRQGKIRWDENVQAFVVAEPAWNFSYAGAINGSYDTASALQEGAEAAHQAAKKLGFDGDIKASTAEAVPAGEVAFINFVPSIHGEHLDSYQNHFVDLQRDQSVKDVMRATGAGMYSVEHIKRYTSISTANDQGKTSAVASIGVMSQILETSMDTIGTTTFRAPYSPISYVGLAGRQRGQYFDPIRRTPMDHQHEALNVVWEIAGEWRRAGYYPRNGETRDEAVRRETIAARQSVGMIDASTLGKIEIRGKDAAEFINRIYTNGYLKLKVGKGRYGVMTGVDGKVFDDGVTLRLAEDRFLMHTTSGGAQHVLNWLENWHQTEWSHLDATFTSVSEQFATVTISGPKSRRVLEKLVQADEDVSNEGFAFLDFRDLVLDNGIPARVSRISFTGELSYEIAVPTYYGAALWDAVAEAGAEYDITPYGLAAQRVLRAEKGFVIVGQDSDGTNTPHDLNMDWVVSKLKRDFLGMRSYQLDDFQRDDRHELVGLMAVDKTSMVRDGAALVDVDAPEANGTDPVPTAGFVTGYYDSAALGRTFGMAMIKGGKSRIGERVKAPAYDPPVEFEITDLSPYDPEGERRDGEL